MFSSKSIKKLAGTTLAAIAVSVAAVAPAAIAQPVNHVRLTASTTFFRNDDRDPRLHAALRALENAKTELQNADRDSAGHREKALDHVQQAIDETRRALRHDH